eukprot:gene13895-25790_t
MVRPSATRNTRPCTVGVVVLGAVALLTTATAADAAAEANVLKFTEADSPSRFTLQAGATLAAACTSTMDQSSIDRDSHASHSTNNQAGGVLDDDTSTFAVAARAAALDNWYRALCASAYDPAYMPAQVAITTGLACIVACDTAGHQPSRTGMANLAAEAISASEAKRVMPFCGAFLDNAKQGYEPLPFASVGSNLTMLKELTVELTKPTGACGCAPASSGFGSPTTPITAVVGLVALAVSLMASVVIYVIRRRRQAASVLVLREAEGSKTDAVSGSGHRFYADEDAALLE